MNTNPEPFVGVASIADFLDEKPRNVLRWTRQGTIRGYAISGKRRHQYKYRKSEIAEDIKRLRNPGSKMDDGSPSDS